jgi:hypothetical protein
MNRTATVTVRYPVFIMLQFAGNDLKMTYKTDLGEKYFRNLLEA